MKAYPGKRFIQFGLLWLIIFSTKEIINLAMVWQDIIEDIHAGTLSWSAEIYGILVLLALVNIPGIILLLIGLHRARKAGVYSQNPSKQHTITVIWYLLWIPLLLIFRVFLGLSAV